MGTRGWFVFLHKGKYYRFYNHFDSYFTGLGVDLINALVTGGDELLAAIRKLLDLGITTKNGDAYGWRIDPPSSENTDLVAEWEAAERMVKNRMPFKETDAKLALQDHDKSFLFGDGCFIEYIYVIDLDREQFLAGKDTSDIVFSYPIKGLHPDFMEDAEEGKLPEGASWSQSFPIPKVELDKMEAAFKDEGYQLEQLEPTSLGLDACVFKALNIESGERVCIKVFYSDGRPEGSCVGYKRPMAVAEMLLRSPHPNIVRIIQKNCKYELPALFLEAYDGNLVEVLSDLKLDAYKEARVVCHALADVAQGTIFLHKKGIVHHDIKPENILVRVGDDQKSVHAAICDFESIGISFPSSEVDLDWGPFAENATSLQKQQRWLDGWGPMKWTTKYSHPSRESVDPWSLDSYSLSIVVEKYLKIDSGWEAMDEMNKSHLRKLREEVMSILRDDSASQNGASHNGYCENLEQASKLLRAYANSEVGHRTKRKRQSSPDPTEE